MPGLRGGEPATYNSFTLVTTAVTGEQPSLSRGMRMAVSLELQQIANRTDDWKDKNKSPLLLVKENDALLTQFATL